MRMTEAKLRSIIREELFSESKKLREASQSGNPMSKFMSSLSSINLTPEIKESVIAVKSLEAKITSSLSIDAPTLGMLLVAALAISGRESTYGQGRRYQWTSWAESLASEYGLKDTSVGPTQVKYGANFGPGTELAGYGTQVGITGAASLSEYPKAIMATIGMLSKLHKKAASLGYTNEAGVASKSFKSTGNAALDLALIGYNMGAEKVSNYCGTQAVKKPCPPGSPDIAKNYIPNFTDEGLSSLGYISEVSAEMSKFASLRTLF